MADQQDVDDQLLQPSVGYNVVFGLLHGYVEAYGNGVSDVTAKYEIVGDDAAAPLLEADVTPRMAGETRAIFTPRHARPSAAAGLIHIARHAGVGRADGQGFNTSLRSGGACRADDVRIVKHALHADRRVSCRFLKTMLSRAFNLGEASRKETVQAFRARVPEKSLPAFDKGVQAFNAGSYPEAEATFKSAIDPDADSSAIIAYLAAVFAAAGHDQQAAGAWQTSLIDGSDFPQVYDWLAGSLLRARDLSTARSMLEEAVSKWPSDVRFARPMAFVYATFGQGARCGALARTSSAAHKDDVESLFMGVEWIYQLHSAGVLLHTPADDLKLARSYADAYTKAKGPQAALVKQWVGFLETKK